MAGTRDAASEERERLERFLEWRHATGREPGSFGWRWLSYVAGIVVLGVIVVALSALLTGDLRGTRGRLANAPERLASESPSAPAQDITPSAAPTSEVSLPERPSPIERAEPSAPRPPSEALALPLRSPASPRASVSPRPTPEERSQPFDVVAPALAPGAQDSSSESRTEGASIAPPTPPPSSPPILLGAAPSAAPPPPPPPPPTQAVPNAAPAEPPVSNPPVAAPSAAPGEPLSGTPTAAARPITAGPAPPPPPPAAPVKPAPRPVPAPEVATKPLPEPIETVKRLIERIPELIEHIPEVKVGRAIRRWVTSQPAADPAPPPPEPRSPQTR